VRGEPIVGCRRDGRSAAFMGTDDRDPWRSGNLLPAQKGKAQNPALGGGEKKLEHKGFESWN